jgi:hypothetical protein
VATVLAAGLLHLLTLTVAEPRRFFRSIMALVTLIAVITPLTLADQADAKIATALITLAIGAVIVATLDSVAGATSLPRPPERHDTTVPTRQWSQPPTYPRTC